jgi:hypothetical protein
MDLPLTRLRQVAEAISIRLRQEYELADRRAEWQTRTTCQFIAATFVEYDPDKTGGKNPLSDIAADIRIHPERSSEDDELERMRGERTGYVSHEEGARMMRGGPKTAPKTDTIEIDEDGNVVGAALSAPGSEESSSEGMAEPQAGSFEAFMRMFGSGGMPPPTGPVPH